MGQPAAADRRDRFLLPQRPCIDLFDAVEHAEQILAENPQRGLQVANHRAEDAVLRREQHGQGVHRRRRRRPSRRPGTRSKRARSQ